MQAILRDVSAHTVDDKDSTWTLRPLTRPLHRYRAADGSVLDGALFALAQGTDPEALLLIEARAEGTTTRWYSAVARLTDLKIEVRHRGREIFAGPHTTGRPGEVYLVETVVLKPSDRPEDFFDAP